LLKILKYLLPLYIGAALGPLGGFGVVTLLPVLSGKGMHGPRILEIILIG
jgi:hypothetical protein